MYKLGSLLTVLLFSACQKEVPVTTASLLEEMTDRAVLVKCSELFYETGQSRKISYVSKSLENFRNTIKKLKFNSIVTKQENVKQ